MNREAIIKAFESANNRAFSLAAEVCDKTKKQAKRKEELAKIEAEATLKITNMVNLDTGKSLFSNETARKSAVSKALESDEGYQKAKDELISLTADLSYNNSIFQVELLVMKFWTAFVRNIE